MEVTKKINLNIFRQYDVRGIVGEDLNEDIAYTVGKAFGSYVKRLGEDKVIIGHDNRLSSPALYEALQKGITETGIDIISLGLCT